MGAVVQVAKCEEANTADDPVCILKQFLRKKKLLIPPETFQHFKLQTFSCQDFICKEGEKEGLFYILVEGTVRVICQERVVNTLTPGDSFGERALLSKSDKRTSSCIALSRVRVYSIERVLFHDLYRHTWEVKSSEKNFQPAKLQLFEPNEFNIEFSIGEGAYGEVFVAKHKSGQKYALKCVSKHHVCEAVLMNSLCHKNIVSFIGMIPDQIKPQLVMQWCEKGDLWDSLHSEHSDFRKGDQLQQVCICKIIGKQIAEALTYLHKKNIMYRDLKPENIAIDRYNQVRIIDLGFARRLDTNDTVPGNFTICGTPVYMAPEMLCKQAYSYSIDIWALGIVLHEMLFGCSPFDVSKIVQKNFVSQLTRMRRIANQYVRNRKIFKHLTKPELARSIFRNNKSYDASVADILLRCLNPDPHCRPIHDKLIHDPFFKM